MLITFFGTLLSFLITTLCILLLAFFAYQFHLSQNGVKIGITCTYVISCFMGGMFSGRKREKKYIKGGIVGVVYLFVILVCSYFKYDSFSYMQDTRMLVIGAICIGSGVLGGMLA